MRKTAAAIALIVLTSNVIAAKCRNQKDILYTQDQYCPAGYTDITTDRGGTVSSIGKNESTIRQEQDFLRRRAAENGQHQAQIAQEHRQFAQQQSSNSTLCAGLASNARSFESAMRQPNSPQWLDYLKQQHRAVRDQMYRNRC